jgi:hypothetical protein
MNVFDFLVIKIGFCQDSIVPDMMFKVCNPWENVNRQRELTYVSL